MIYFIRPLNTYVLKFGGSVLIDSNSSTNASSLVKKLVDRGDSLVIVVSALKGETDRLLQSISGISSDKEDTAEVIAMGERTSARLMTAALKSVKVPAVLVDPKGESWPIFTHGDFLDADIDMNRTKQAVEERIKPLLLKGMVPVVCGFMGLNADGRIQTLGRGGSDTSAVVLGSCLGAREVVLLKDVGAAFSADPRKTNGTRTIETLDASEALALSLGGSKLIHSKAFRYLKGTNLRITSIELGLEGGTLIDAQSSVNLTALDEDISMVTLVARRATMELVNSIGKILEDAGAELLGMTLGGRSLLLYLKGGSNVVDSLHSKLVDGEEVKAISEIKGLAEITVRSDFLERAPGYISDITAPLSASEINIYGISTISSSIKLYVLAKDLDIALNLIKKELEDREL